MGLHMFKIFVLSIGIFISGNSWAGNVAAEIDPQNGELGEAFQLTITIAGSLSGHIELPSVPNIEVMGTGSSTNVSIINGSFSKETAYTFNLVPQKAGTFTIPSFKLKVDDEELVVPAVRFSVNGGGTSSSQSRAQASSPDEENVDTKTASNVFIERSFSKTNPYEGEPIVMTTKIFHRVQIANVEVIHQKPVGVRIVDIKQGNTQEEREGAIYNVIVVKQALIPTRSGSIAIPGFRIRAAIVMPSENRQRRRGRGYNDFFDDFFNRAQNRVVQKVIASEDSELKVKAIPTEGRPADYKGIVGTFRMASEISPTELKAGETSTLSLSIDGVGALDTVGNLDLKLGSSVRVYADKAQAEEHASEKWGLESKRVLRFALVPTHKGDLNLGTLKIPYFDPSRGHFAELSSDLGMLKVAEGEENKAASSQAPLNASETPSPKLKADVQALASDLIDIHRRIDARSQVLTIQEYGLAAALLGIPSLLCLLAFLVQTIGQRGRSNLRMRRKNALRKFQSRMEQLQQSDSGNTQDTLEKAYNVFRDFIGDSFDMQGSSLTSKELAPRLQAYGVPEQLLKELENLSVRVEHSQYAGTSFGKTDLMTMLESMQHLAQEIGKKC